MITSRIFAAIPVPSDVGREVLRVAEAVGNQFPGLRQVDADDLHITIEFLGDVSESDLPRVCQELQDSASESSSFRISLGAMGTFPGEGKAARVLWLGIDEGRAELTQLHNAFLQRVRDLGTAGNAKAYVPHLTLARLSKKQSSDFGTELTQFAEEQCDGGLSFQARKLVLYATVKERGKIFHDALCTVGL